MSEVCGRSSFLHLESSRVCLQTDTHRLCKILYRWTLKNWPEGASSMRDHPPPTHTLEKRWGAGFPAPPGPNAYELLKTPSHRLIRSQYCGIVWVKEEGSWRDLEICASPKVGGGDLLPPPFPGKWGGASAPFAPPVPTPMGSYGIQCNSYNISSKTIYFL